MWAFLCMVRVESSGHSYPYVTIKKSEGDAPWPRELEKLEDIQYKNCIPPNIISAIVGMDSDKRPRGQNLYVPVEEFFDPAFCRSALRETRHLQDRVTQDTWFWYHECDIAFRYWYNDGGRLPLSGGEWIKIRCKR